MTQVESPRLEPRATMASRESLVVVAMGGRSPLTLTLSPPRTSEGRCDSLESEDMLHIVESRRLFHGPERGLQGTSGKSLAARGFVGEFQAFAVRSKDDGVVANDIPSAERMHADFVAGPLPDNAVPSVPQGFTELLVPHGRENFREGHGGAAGSVLF